MWLLFHLPVLRGGTLGCVAWQREDVNANQAGAHLGRFPMPGRLEEIERLSCYGLTGAIVVWFNFLQILAWLPSFHRQDKACLSLCPGCCQPGWLREAGTCHGHYSNAPLVSCPSQSSQESAALLDPSAESSSMAWTPESPHAHASVTEPELMTWTEFLSPSPAKSGIYSKSPHTPSGPNPLNHHLTSRKPQSPA